MEEELEKVLKENLEVSKESLKILKKINRARIIGNLFSFLKWLIIIGISVGVFYYLQPYLDQATAALEQLKNFMPR